MRDRITERPVSEQRPLACTVLIAIQLVNFTQCGH